VVPFERESADAATSLMAATSLIGIAEASWTTYLFLAAFFPGGQMINIETETPRGKARRGIRAAQRAVAAASKLEGHRGVRKQIAEVGVLARKMRRRDAWDVEFERFARHRGVSEIRSNGSPHLQLFRALGVDRPASTLNRYANVVEVCLRNRWSSAEIRRRITRDGPEAILWDYPYIRRRRIRRRRP
jgi:hypothetical protein